MSTDDEVYESHDELMAAMERDEAADATKLTPREYGKYRGIAPQLVYYHIRNGHVVKERCICNRVVIDVDQADKYFKKGAYSEDSNQVTE